jgi:hypothetical protein
MRCRRFAFSPNRAGSRVSSPSQRSFGRSQHPSLHLSLKIKFSLPPLRPLDSHPFHQLTGETHLRKHHVGSAIALEDGKDFHPIFKAIKPKKEG